MNTIELFKCGECGQLHELEDNAAICCRPDVYKVYECGFCHRIYETKEDADKCCEEAKQ